VSLPSRVIGLLRGPRVAQLVPFGERSVRIDRPIASFSFDDFPRSALTEGGAILARHGGRGTYYVAGSLCGQAAGPETFCTQDDIRAAHEAGHEVAAHTFAHTRVNDMAGAAIRADAAANDAFLHMVVPGLRLDSFAYPFGQTSIRSKRVAGRLYPVCRSTVRGLVRGRIDPAQVPSVSLEMFQWDPAGTDALIAQARDNPAWITFYTHEVRADPSRYGSTPQMLEEVVHKVAEAGFAILPVAEAARRIGALD
jgi:peptidoglycan/xylan/chitin deacetylase (PgdA/CDA1 family)